ncbi:hypothetical protein [Ignatzschineria sp. F8392]|uniref:hypothetical protein n=1 Tax=Ignatzschineria sp. F8392 TaxID=1980117 RepID=UPI0013035D61|nr:hypothetical protein [Ignatzschineria sp. F8392]
MILKKIRGAAGTDYFILLTLHARSLASSMPLAGTQLGEERDSDSRQLISFCCFNESF